MIIVGSVAQPGERRACSSLLRHCEFILLSFGTYERVWKGDVGDGDVNDTQNVEDQVVRS